MPPKSYKTAKLEDGTQIYCLNVPEAQMLDYHINGYMHHDIALKDGDILFDVGANIGVLGVRTVQRYPNAQVYAFEPLPDIFDVLKANAQKYGDGRLKLFNIGISDAAGNTTFSYYPNSPALSTAHDEDWQHDPTAFQHAVEGNLQHLPPQYRMAKYLPGFVIKLIARWLRRGRKQINCELKTLSQIIDENKVSHINLLKIDCEGAELRVLQGIQPQHWPLIRQIVAEVHDIDGRVSSVTQLCQQAGFDKIIVEKDAIMGNTALYNIFATRKPA